MVDPRLSALRQIADAALAGGAPAERVAEQLAEVLASCDEDDRYERIDALEGARDPWVAALLRRLVASDPSHPVQELALERLAEHPSAETHRFLLGLLPERYAWSLTRIAARLLADYPSDRDVGVVARNTAADRLIERNRPRLAPAWEAVAHEGNAAGSTAREALRDLAQHGTRLRE